MLRGNPGLRRSFMGCRRSKWSRAANIFWGLPLVRGEVACRDDYVGITSCVHTRANYGLRARLGVHHRLHNVAFPDETVVACSRNAGRPGLISWVSRGALDNGWVDLLPGAGGIPRSGLGRMCVLYGTHMPRFECMGWGDMWARPGGLDRRTPAGVPHGSRARVRVPWQASGKD